MTYSKSCIVCGVQYEGTGPAQKYCVPCGTRIDKEKQRKSVDKYRAKHGVLVGVGSGNAQGRGVTHHTYKTGIGTFRELKINSMSSLVCEDCGKDLSQIVYIKRFLWCVHHIDQDRQNNSLDNLKLLCKSCHQKIHCAAAHLNKG